MLIDYLIVLALFFATIYFILGIVTLIRYEIRWKKNQQDFRILHIGDDDE